MVIPLTFVTITAIQLAYPYVSSDKISCTETDEPDRDAEYLLHLTEAATLWNEMKKNFITGFSDGRSKFHYRLPNAQQNAERATQQRKQKQRYMDFKLLGLKPSYLQLKARKQLMESPNAFWNDFCTHNFQEDIMLPVCSKFLHDMEQIKTELSTMRKEMRNLRTELQEHRVNCMEGNSRPWAPTQKGKQKTVRFCNYCQKNGHTPNWCRKKMQDEEIRRVQRDMSLKKTTAPIREYGTSESNCRSQHNQNVDRCPESDDVNIPTNKLLTTEEETCLDESNDLTPPETTFLSRTNAMSFNMAQVTSVADSDDELSDPLPLGY